MCNHDSFSLGTLGKLWTHLTVPAGVREAGMVTHQLLAPTGWGFEFYPMHILVKPA